MKRILSLAFVLVMLASAAGCAGTGSGSGSSDTPAAQSTEPAGESTSSEASGEPAASGDSAKLSFWDMNWGSGNDDYINAGTALVSRFNTEHPDITVEYQSIPWDNYYQVFLTAISSGAGPDIATAGSQVPIQFAQMGEILSLNSIVEEWQAEGIVIDDLLPGFLESNHYNGEYIALPWNADPRVWTYRTDYFAEAGISEMPKDWAGLLDALRALKKTYPGKVPYALYGDIGGVQHLMNWLTVSNDCGPVDKEENAAFNSQNMKECLEFVATLADEGLVSEAAISYKQADADRLFASGEAALYMGGMQNVLLQDETLADKLDILDPMMGPSATKAQTVVWANSIAGYRQTKSPDQVKVFIKWWLENSLTLFTEGHATQVPARISFMDDAYFQSNIFQVAIQERVYPTFTHATYPVESFYPAYGQINGERYTGEAAQKVLSGRRDFDAILAEGQAQTEAAVQMVKDAAS